MTACCAPFLSLRPNKRAGVHKLQDGQVPEYGKLVEVEDAGFKVRPAGGLRREFANSLLLRVSHFKFQFLKNWKPRLVGKVAG